MTSKLKQPSSTKLLKLNQRYIVYLLIIVAVIGLAIFRNNRDVQQSLILGSTDQATQTQEFAGILVGNNNSNLKYAITSYQAVAGVTDTQGQLLSGVLPAKEGKEPEEIALQVMYSDQEANIAILQLGNKVKSGKFLTYRAEDITPINPEEKLYTLSNTSGSGTELSDYSLVPIKYDQLYPVNEDADVKSDSAAKTSGVIPILDENENMVGVLTDGETNNFVSAQKIGEILTSGEIQVFFVGQQRWQFILSTIAAFGLITLSVTATALKRKKIREKGGLKR